MTESAQGALRIVHAHGDRITISDTGTGVELLSYVYRPPSRMCIPSGRWPATSSRTTGPTITAGTRASR
jgi:hypothetical protein